MQGTLPHEGSPQPRQVSLGHARVALVEDRGDRKVERAVAEKLESLRNERGGFDIEASIIHPGGAYEFYAGQVKNGRIDIRTVAGSHMPMHLIEAGKGWGYAERMYGTLNQEGVTKLLWVMEVANSVRDEPVPLVSVELNKVD